MNESSESRESLKEALRDLVLGEVRLSKSDRDTILETCREVHIDEECSEGEKEVFIRFAADELEKAIRRHSAEQLTWPSETDCDRLDRVEASLRNRGILLWQVSPCCDTCTIGEFSERIDEVERQYPGFRDRIRGYAFFIDQNMAEMLAEDTEIAVYLGYGWFSPDDTDVAPDIYEKSSLGIAKEVCDCFRENGFEPDWDGSFSRKIGVTLNWQRRSTLL